MSREKMPIGVFTSPVEGHGPSLDDLVDMGVQHVQLHTPGPDQRNADHARRVAEMYDEAGIEITLVFCGFPGDSYKSIPIVRRTVGLVPPETREERVQQTRDIADYASQADATGIGIHIGFVSEDWDSPDFAAIAHIVEGLADYCAGLGLTMNLETGQESADTLLHLLQTVDRDNLKVNFDPANMIMYGSGEPLAALRKVGDYVGSCHCKDAVWSDEPGDVWGREVQLGEGDVDIQKFIATLHDIGYDGPLTIEREIRGPQQIEDMRAAIALLERIKEKLGIGTD